mgnify:CR=1 FL=1
MSGTRKPGPLKDAVDSAIKSFLYRALSDSHGVVGLAAQRSGIHRTQFYDLMRKHGIKIERQVRRTVKASLD